MDQIEMIITAILKITAIITAIGAAWAYIKKWNAESKGTKNSTEIKEHTVEIKTLKERVAILESNTHKQDKFISAMCESMLALLDHNINGNSIDKLKAAKEEIQEFLIYRG